MRIPSGSTDRWIFFVAIDSVTLLKKTGLTAFTVFLTRDAQVAVSDGSVTVQEVDATNADGLYRYRVDQQTYITPGHQTEELAIRITATGMLDIDRTVELSVENGDLSVPTIQTHVIGASGYSFVHTVFEADGITARNISSYTGTVQLGFSRPKQAEDLVTAVFNSDGTDGKLKYTVAAAFWDVVGMWTASCKIDNGASDIYRDKPVWFNVVRPSAISELA